MKTKTIFTIILSFFSSFFAWNQQLQHETPPLPCGQNELLEYLKETLPGFAEEYLLSREILEEETKKTKPKAGTIYTIPIVFHILHEGGEENISDNQVFDAVRILNEDFRKQNPDASSVVADFQNLVADVGIEFELATIAPNGTCF